MPEITQKKDKIVISENTVIAWGVPVVEYTKFMSKATGKKTFSDFSGWPYSQTGKTLAEALEEYQNPSGIKNMEQFMSERRFNHVSESEKEFIISFDKEISEMGYDFGGIIGSAYNGSATMIVYGKTGTKSRPIVARIYINDDEVVLRLFLNKVDKHREYIENAPAHITDAFDFAGGDCKSCNTMCAPGKVYTINDRTMHKCNHRTFFFNKPTTEKIFDYMGLLKKFYPEKKSKPTK